MKLLLLSIALGLHTVVMADEDPVSRNLLATLPGSKARALLAKLDGIEAAKTLEARRRDIPAGLKALIDADHDTLLGAMTLDLLDDGGYRDPRRMLIEQCAERWPQEAVRGLGTQSSSRILAEATWQVWSVIARTDPDRAMGRLQAFYEAGEPSSHSGGAERPVIFIALAVGRQWFVRDGAAAIQKLGSLPHSEDLDGYLLEGMCESASQADDLLALLSWFTGPGRDRVHMSHKGWDPWWEQALTRAAQQDLDKAKAWVEHEFPPQIKRRSNKEKDFDGVDFRRVLFHEWARRDALAAANWQASLYAADDPDGEQALLDCTSAVAGQSAEGIQAGLRWLAPFKNRPCFIGVLASVLSRAGENQQDETDLREAATWMSTLPLETREQILLTAKKDLRSFRSRLELSMSGGVLQWCVPDEGERKGVLERLQAELNGQSHTTRDTAPAKVLDLYEIVGNEFKLPHRQSARKSSEEERGKAARLAGQYEAITTGLDPRKRLAGLPALDWLARASPAQLRDTLLAHLENRQGRPAAPDVLDDFTLAMLDAWAANDLVACENFAWDAALPLFIRRALLVETFKAEASRKPDEVYQRLTKLAVEGRFLKEAVMYDGMDVQWGGNCYMGWVPQKAGAAWIQRDRVAALHKLKSLPDEWQDGAVKGAVEGFTKAEAGLALLDWLEELNAQDMQAIGTATKPQSHPYRYKRLMHTALKRLANIDIEAAQRWVEAKPARLAKEPGGSSSFIDDVYHPLFWRDAAAAKAWMQRVKP